MRIRGFSRLGLRLKISLDGMAEIHYTQRPTISGQGSFAAALRGIERTITAGATPDISITVTGQSVVGLPDPIGWLLDRDQSFSISLYRKMTAVAGMRSFKLMNGGSFGDCAQPMKLLRARPL